MQPDQSTVTVVMQVTPLQPTFGLRRILVYTLITVSFAASMWVNQAKAETVTPADFQAFIDSDARQDDRVRDIYRHPAATLAFFDVEPDMSVVEIWPGGGWYADILGPYLSDHGQYVAAHFDPDSDVEYFRNSRARFAAKVTRQPKRFGSATLTVFDPGSEQAIAPDGSADRVLSFRNVHNWYMRGGGDERVLAAFKTFYRALKPGGVLGIVEHRLAADRPLVDQQRSGYLHQDYVIRMAEQAGFILQASSEINANPADSTRYPEGVWTLPPSYRLGEQDRARYQAIGESDRMTLKFIKPVRS
ncbi:class I SAM-dependent methyltransferase [Oceanobacter antarcticus]|jgi:predicted methyltransferase|uniref:Methyltransferase n=1 Tax=Oceanobacter antarcticus TaxID=3133425 RepID=A0ABW8NNV9_9GAMM